MKYFMLLLSITSFSFIAQALEHWHVPIESELKTVKVVNRDKMAHTFWLSGPIHQYQEPMETSIEVPAFGTIEIPLINYKQWPWIHLKAQDQGHFQVQVHTRFDDFFLVASGPSSRWKARVKPQSSLVIYNTSALEQKVSVSNQTLTETHVLPALGKLRLSLARFENGSMLTIEGETRIGGVMLTSQGSKALTPDTITKTLTPLPGTDSHYFLMANSDSSQSFVVEISNPALLTSIKNQLQDPGSLQGRILIGRIAYGSNQINRDHLERRKTPWSWHVAEAVTFAEFASQECDGSPEMLEEVLKPWLGNGTPICFWNYRVKKELSLTEMKNRPKSKPLGLGSLRP